MKFILTFLLLHCLQSCNIYYNQDISFDLIDLKVDNFPLNEKKTLYINICGNLKYQCQKQEDSVVMVANEASTQNIIITEGKECDFYSREHELNSNDLELITENKPFGGFLLNVQGVEDDKTLKFLLVCKNSQTFQVETLCEYDVCLSHSSVCPDLVYNPLMDLYRDLYIPIGILSMLIGIIFIIFGFRYIRITTILMGFIFSFVLYTIVMSESVLDQDSSGFALIMIICSGIGVAVIYANCVYTRQLLSYFNVGLVFASVLSLLSQSIFLHFFTPHPMFLALSLILVSSGILFGILAMKFVNGLGIGGTALTGAYLIIRPLAWFVGGYPNEIYLVKQQFYGFSKSIDFRFYLYFSSIFVITIGSIFIQYRQLQQRMSMDQMMQYQDLNYYEMGNFQEKAISSEVKGFQVESEIIKEQFVKKLDNEIRKSNSSNSSN